METAYTRAPLTRALCWGLIIMLGLPPGLLIPRASAASRRGNTMSRIAELEAFRNPMISNGWDNRFLFSFGPTDLVGGGGDAFSSPGRAGVTGFAEPIGSWLSVKGQTVWEESDLWTPGVGLDLVFTRVHRESVTSYAGPLGNEWDFNWNVRLEEDGSSGDVTLLEMGREETYTEDTGSYTSPSGRYDTLEKDTAPTPDEFTRTDKQGVVERYEYDSDGGGITAYRLQSISDPNGNALSFAYDASSNLTKVTDTLSQDTLLTYDASDRITKIADHASREWLYAYDANGQLTAVRTPVVDEAGSEDDYTSGKTTSYEYDGSDRLAKVIRPKDSTTYPYIHNQYDASGYLTKQVLEGQDQTLIFDGGAGNVTVSDREAQWFRYAMDGSGRITQRRDYTLIEFPADTTYSYDADNEVTQVIFPLLNRVAYTYDGTGNILSVTFKKDANDADPIRWVYSYTGDARVSTLTDPNGNTWDYDYDGAGNLTARTAPAVTVPAGIVTTDNNGNGTYDGTIADAWAYNGRGQVTSWTDPSGTVTEYAYTTVNSVSAYLTKVTRDAGEGKLNLITQYAYDGAGNVTSVTDPGGHATSYTVNDLNQVIGAVEPLSVTKKWHYDGNDQLTKTEASNDTSTGDGWYVVDYNRDQYNRLTSQIEDATDAVRLTTTYELDKLGRVTRETDPEGRVTERGWDLRDNVVSVTRKAASAADDAITGYRHTKNNQLQVVTTPLLNDITTSYNLYGRVTKRINPEGDYTTYAYDKAGNVTDQRDYNAGNTKLTHTLFSYDQANRLYQTGRLAKKADLSTNIGDGSQTETVWRDELGRVLQYSDDACGCSNVTSVYDAVGRRVTVKDPMPGGDQNLVLTEYDADGNVTKTTREDASQDTGIEADKSLVTEAVFDARDRMVTRRDKLAAETYADTLYFYGLRDQLTKVVDPVGDQVLTYHNEKLWKTKEVAIAVLDTPSNLESNDVVTEYGYDYGGLVITYKAKNGITGDQVTVYTFDNLGRLVTTTWPDAGTTIHTYDKESNRISTTDPMGTVVVCAYDDNSRLTHKDITLAGNVIGIDDVTYGYDGAGRLTSADTAEGMDFSTSVVRTYNTLGKIESETQVIDGYASGAGRTIGYVWDEKAQKTGVTYPVSAQVVSYARDALERADSITRNGSEIVDYAFSGRRVLSKSYPGSEALYTYDGLGRVTDIHHKDSSSTNTLARFSYGWVRSSQVTHLDKVYYDDVQNTRLLADTSDLGDQYAYDGAKRLVTTLRGVPTAYISTAMADNITNEDYDDLVEYDYDQTGNRLTRRIDAADDVTYAYNTVNEMTTEGGVGQNFTAAGNWSGTDNAFKYDFSNRLAEATPDADIYTWHYDALGRRVQQDDPNGDETRFYYDGIGCVEEVAWDGETEAQTKLFVYGERIDELLEYVDVSANPDDTYYAHSDMLGSVQVLADENGSIAESYRYREFGVTTVVDSTWAKLTTNVSAVGNPFRYTGRRLDEVISGGGLEDAHYYYRAREMRPDVGRLLQATSRRNVGSANSYVYVVDYSVNRHDPTGQEFVAEPRVRIPCGLTEPLGTYPPTTHHTHGSKAATIRLPSTIYGIPLEERLSSPNTASIGLSSDSPARSRLGSTGRRPCVRANECEPPMAASSIDNLCTMEVRHWLWHCKASCDYLFDPHEGSDTASMCHNYCEFRANLITVTICNNPDKARKVKPGSLTNVQ